MFPFNFQVSGNNCGFWGAIHPTKISGNFGLKLNGLVRCNRKSFEKISPSFEGDHFSRLDQSDQNGPFHLTILTHSQSQDLAVWYPCTKKRKRERKILITALLRIVNSRSIGVTHTSMYSYHRSVAASRAKCMFWLSMALKDDLFSKRICNVLFVIWFRRTWCWRVWSHMANIWEWSAQNKPLYWLKYYEWSSSHNIIDITCEIAI